MKHYPTFSVALNELRHKLRLYSSSVHPAHWQGMDVSEKPEMGTRELLNVSFTVPIQYEDLERNVADIGPNLPWADTHFLERVGGEPLNPGESWKSWPFAKSAIRFIEQHGRFTHTYMERIWPKNAGDDAPDPNYGLWYQLGDLSDVVRLLAKDPLTRQAYLPIFFPEDTGAVHGGRIPCSIGYHFIMRGNYLHCVYQLRSCDYVRHFRDDIYLAVRLMLWVLHQLQTLDAKQWGNVRVGTLTMHITSLHVFEADVRNILERAD